MSRVAALTIAAAVLATARRDPETFDVSYREFEPEDPLPDIVVGRTPSRPAPRLIREKPAYIRREPETLVDLERVRMAEERRARKLSRQAKGFVDAPGMNTKQDVKP